MTTYLRQKFKTNLALALAESFSVNSPDDYFIFVGRTQSWPDNDIPPEAVDSFDEEIQAWQNMIAMGKLNSSNVVVGAKRYDWVYNTVFDQYDSSIDLYEEGSEKKYYCITDDLNVYKCLSNNYGSPSLYKPTSQTPEEEITQDGYIWKFMFKVREEMYDFLMEQFIPIEKLTNIIYSDDRSLQNNVRISSVPGSIENIVIYQFGGSYPIAIVDDEVGGGEQKHKILQAVTTTQFKLAPLADLSRTTGTYDDYYELYISEGPGAGQKAVISNYSVSSTNSSDITVDLATPLIGVTSQSVYRIYPRIKITGDGENASAIPVMNSNKLITDIKIINSGSNYHFATVDVYRKNATYSNKTLAKAIISPLSGHGFDAILELGSNMMLINVPLNTRDEALINDNLRNLLTNDYRQIGILKNAYQNDPDNLVLLGSGEEYNTIMEIESLNYTSTITFYPNSGFCVGGGCTSALLSLFGATVTQGEDVNPSQARGVIEAVTFAADKPGAFVITVSNTNGRFLPSTESNYNLTVNGQIISSDITGVIREGSFDINTFSPNDFILGAETGSTAKVVSWTSNAFGTSGTLKINDIKGKFNSSYFSKSTGTTVLVRGENIVGYSAIDSNTGQINSTPDTVGIIKAVYPEVNDTKIFYKVTTTLTITPDSGSFTTDLFKINDIIANGTDDTVANYAQARVIGYTPPSGTDNITAKLEINNISGEFEVDDILYFVSGTNITNARITEIDEPEVLSYYGDVLYIQNVQPISTSDDTEEQIKVLITF